MSRHKGRNYSDQEITEACLEAGIPLELIQEGILGRMDKKRLRAKEAYIKDYYKERNQQVTEARRAEKRIREEIEREATRALRDSILGKKENKEVNKEGGDN